MARLRRGGLPLLFALALLLVFNLPYAIGSARQTADWRFSGVLFGLEDTYSYLAKMRQGAGGAWDFSLFYTAEPHEGAPLVYLQYLLPGQIVGRLVPETSPAHTDALLTAWALMRIGFDALYLWVLWRVIRRVLAGEGARLTAYVLAALGGGLGWLLPLLGGGMAAEFYIPEGFSPLVLLGMPHLALARAAMLGGLLLLLAALDRPAMRQALPWALGAGGCWLVTGLSVPFTLAVILALLGVLGLGRWLQTRRFPAALFWRALAAAAPVLPLFAWYALVFSTRPAFVLWSAQNQLPSPPPLVYGLAYVLLIVPAVAGGRALWRSGRAEGALLVSWAVAALPLAYVPLAVQRRMLEGAIVPLALLAAAGLAGWAGERRLRRVLAGVWLAAGFVPALMLLVGAYNAAWQPGPPLFRPAGEREAFEWLNAHAAPGDVVLSGVETGNALPVFAHVRVYMGHGPETLEWPRKRAEVLAFFSGGMDVAARATLYAGGGCLQAAPALCGDPIDWLVVGPRERALMGDAPPAWLDEWTPVYQDGAWAIYRPAGA